MKRQTASQAQFGKLMEAHSGIVFKVAHSYSRNPDDRDDIAQEIAVQLWRAYPDFDPEQRFSTWMYRIALNVAISHLRRVEVRQRYIVSTPDAETLAVADTERTQEYEQWQFLERFMAGLDAPNRALMLLYLEERSYREIGDILGLTESNVATKISRLKQRIRRDSAAD